MGDREGLRQGIHAGVGLLALSLRWLSWPQAAALALAGVAFNGFLLPRIPVGAAILRGGEKAFSGVVLYPIAVFGLVCLFPLHLAAAAWGILALGDSVSNFVGRRFGRARLPWNRSKSWAGTCAFTATAFPAALFLLRWTLANPEVGAGARSLSLALHAAVAGCGALAGAIAESARLRLDDNLTVAFGSAGAMAAFEALASGTGGGAP